LIDTGEDVTAEKYVKLLLDTVFPLTGTKTLRAILLSHGHGDHQGGVELLLQEMKRRGMSLPIVYKRLMPGGGDFPARNFPCQHISEGQLFLMEPGVTLKALYSPGHTDDHVCFMHVEDYALFSGDCVLGCGTTVFDDLFEYMNSLQSIRRLMVPQEGGGRAVDSIYPGHGPVIRGNALAKVDEYIAHRTKREEEIYSVLADDEGGLMTSWNIMTAVYGTQISFFVQISAQWNVSHHLQKMAKEGRIRNTWPDQWSVAVGGDSNQK
jgi:glyoxylase-like metal-dependent hydrolase (beta-lactamase superfamily II)